MPQNVWHSTILVHALVHTRILKVHKLAFSPPNFEILVAESYKSHNVSHLEENYCTHLFDKCDNIQKLQQQE